RTAARPSPSRAVPSAIPRPTPAARSMGRRKSIEVNRATTAPRMRTTMKTTSARPTAATRRAVSRLTPPRPARRLASGSDQRTTSNPASTRPASPRTSRRNPRQNPRSAKRTSSRRRTASSAVISDIRSRPSSVVCEARSDHRVACRASDGALARGHRLLLPSHAGLLVVLPFAELREYTSFLTLFLEATDGAVDGLVLLDANPCHSQYSPPLGGKGFLFGEKLYAVKARPGVGRSARMSSWRIVQEALRVVGKHTVSTGGRQACEIRQRVHGPDTYREAR